MKYEVGDKVIIKRDRGYSDITLEFIEQNNYMFVIDSIPVKKDFKEAYVFRQVDGTKVEGQWTGECIQGICVSTDPAKKVSRFQLMDIE